MKVMSSFCVAVFVAILLLSICETISGSYYITNVAKSVIFPLFLMSIEDSIYRIYEKAQDILSNMRYEHLAEFKEAKSMHCVFKNFKSEEDIVLKQKMVGEINLKENLKILILLIDA